ncbi:MAG TPA: SDR family NAD(P)-dependent oxidoreductase [Acidimicrobiia bacterium]|nr:SDR family NAD(P)-dependent oxidoreductase [Acidimicrobiia bacterium]
MVALLDGRVVIVTGGGRGLGRSHCLELAAQGATVVVNDAGVALSGEQGDSDTPAAAVVGMIESAGGRAISDASSVSDWDAMRSLVARTVETFGRLDAVVNNAGILRGREITTLTEADFDRVIDVHLKGTLTLTKHACDHWLEVSGSGGDVTGRVVNTTSGAGLIGNAGSVAYGSAKAGIAALTMIVAMEMEPYGVTANAISPVARTRMTEHAAYPGARDAVEPGQWHPLDPENASPVVAWLVSAESGWLSGAVLRIVGNTLMRMTPWAADESSAYQARSGGRLDVDEIGRAARHMFGTLPRGLQPAR